MKADDPGDSESEGSQPFESEGSQPFAATPATNAAVHTGHDLEAGMFVRTREWVDLFPWLRLGRLLRLAGSPPLLAVVGLALAIWLPVVDQLSRAGASTHKLADLTLTGLTEDRVSTTGPVLVLLGIGDSMLQILPMQMFGQRQPNTRWWWESFGLAWSLLIWTPVALLLLRQGALLCSGRDLQDLRTTCVHVLRRTPSAWLSAVLPVVCVGAFGLVLFAAGRVESLLGDLSILRLPAAVLLLLIAIPCGLLSFGSFVAVPLSWSAVANEAEADPLNALSRGYEYLFRRPLKLLLYLGVSSVPLLLIFALYRAVAIWAIYVTEAMIGDDESQLVQQLVILISFLPVVASLTLGWGLVGGAYLLVRQDANDQEPEDLWVSRQETPPLPTLPGTGDDSG